MKAANHELLIGGLTIGCNVTINGEVQSPDNQQGGTVAGEIDTDEAESSGPVADADDPEDTSIPDETGNSSPALEHGLLKVATFDGIFLHDVQFVDGQHGYAVGGKGEQEFLQSPGGGFIMHTQAAILSTEDAGTTWKETVLPSARLLYSVYFVNRDVGFVAGDRLTDENDPRSIQGSIFKTVDGGATWTALDVSAFQTQYLEGVFFVDELTGWVFNRCYGNLLKTLDSGVTWQAIDTARAYDSIFFDDQHGIAVGNGIAVTTDGGDTWSHQDMTDALFEEIAHAGHGTAYAVGFGSVQTQSNVAIVARTSDQGQTWIDVTPPEDVLSGGLLSGSFSTPESGFVFSNFGQVAKTDDGGAHWEAVPTDAYSMIMGSAYAGEELVAVSFNGEVLKFVP